jgi:dynein heavy chain
VNTESKKEFSSYSIEELLLTSGVEYRNPEKVLGGWLPLEAYDDREMDTKLPSEWVKYSGKDGVSAQGLWRDKDGLCYWRKLRVTKFRPKTERYDGYWENTKEKCRLHRIFVLFDEEDPRNFAKRFKAAFNKRTQADALIKYNYYIENMPKHQIPEVDNMQVGRVLTMTQNSKGLRGKSSSDTTTLLNEVNIDFAKTMNQIIFDKHLTSKGTNLITGKLNLPEKPKAKPTPLLGMITIPPHNFPKQFSKYCCRTLQIKDEVIQAQQEIRKECNEVAVKDVFNPNVTKTMKVDEFNQIQASSISQASYFLKETWVNKIKEIIKSSFSQQGDQKNTAAQGIGAAAVFNLNEMNREAYEQGKLKKFLTQTKFIMQDTLLEMTNGSVRRYVDSVIDFLPVSVHVFDTARVTNMYFS